MIHRLITTKPVNKVVKPKLIMLTKTDEFSSVFSFKKRFSSSFFVVYYRPGSQPHARTGFVVAKKIAKLAVDRNYMRRVLREICRQQCFLPHADLSGQDLLNAQSHIISLPSLDMVIQVKKPFKNVQFYLVKQELLELFIKIQEKINQQPMVNA